MVARNSVLTAASPCPADVHATAKPSSRQPPVAAVVAALPYFVVGTTTPSPLPAPLSAISTCLQSPEPAGPSLTGFHPIRFLPGLKTAELFGRGISSVYQLFTPRNLHALAILRAGIDAFRDPGHRTLLLVFTASLMSLSLKAQHLESGGGYLPGMYYVPPVRKERNPLSTLPRIVSQIAGAADALHASVAYPSPSWTGVGDAVDLSPIPDESIDFAFLDPPFSDKIQFSELNLVWESWLDLADDWGDDELVLNSVRANPPPSGKIGSTDWRPRFGEF